MSKYKKLSHQQRRRITANQNKKLQMDELFTDAQMGPAQQGLIVGRFGQHADVEDSNMQVWRCHIRPGAHDLVAGDEVVWRVSISTESVIQPNESNRAPIQGVIEAIQPRRSLLTRPDYFDGMKNVAANIDQMVIVLAIYPEFSWHLLDRYLVIAQHLDIQPLIVINKRDLASEAQIESITDKLACYQQLGYQTLFLSAKTEQIDMTAQQLSPFLQGKRSIFLGQSGVGKSSLLNQFLPNYTILEGAISDKSKLGMHTTTQSRLYHFSEGGDLVDSPGIRELGMWHFEPKDILNGFIEFEPYIGLCKFRDCNHVDTPHCALITAAEAGEIRYERLYSYQKMVESAQSVKENRHFQTQNN